MVMTTKMYTHPPPIKHPRSSVDMYTNSTAPHTSQMKSFRYITFVWVTDIVSFPLFSWSLLSMKNVCNDNVTAEYGYCRYHKSETLVAQTQESGVRGGGMRQDART